MIESATDGRYSDNAFDLTSGETRRIVFTPSEKRPGAALPEFRFYDLQSCCQVD
jgi:beta-mannosidase